MQPFLQWLSKLHKVTHHNFHKQSVNIFKNIKERGLRRIFRYSKMKAKQLEKIV
jgi:hypothetical protein